MTKTDKPGRRPSKKTEALEIRLSPEEKSAFLDACRKMGRSASAVIRDAMRSYANFGPMARLPGSPIMIVSAFAGAAFGAFALLQINNTADAAGEGRLYGMDRFRDLDANSDTLLTAAEYRLAHSTALAINTEPPSSQTRSEIFRTGELYGEFVGALFARYNADLDLAPLRAGEGRVAVECWSALEAAWSGELDSKFARMDADHNGDVSRIEYSRARASRYQRVFDHQDLDHDGFLQRTEMFPRLRAEGGDSEDVDPMRAQQDLPAHLTICAAYLPASAAPSAASSDAARQSDTLMHSVFADYDIDHDDRISFEEYLSRQN